MTKPAEAWEKIKPFAMMDLGALFGQFGGSSSSGEEMFILLFDVSIGNIEAYPVTSSGLDQALGAANSGDTVWLPPSTIGGDHEIPTGVHLDGYVGAVLTGTITANPGARLAEEVDILNLRWYEAPPQAPGGSLTLISGTTVTIVNDSANNSFPAFTKMANGNLIVVYRAGTDHATSKGTLLMRTSTDLGATWSSASTVASDATYDVRDPGILLTSTGRLVVTFYKYDHTVPDYRLDGAYVTYSDNNGSTWSSLYNINSAFTDYCTSGSSPPIQLSDGKLIATLRGKDTGDTHESSSIVVSSDNGATWGSEMIVGDGQADSRNYAEGNLVILPSGEILLMMRSDPADPANGQFYRARSRDGGITWETPTAVFGATGNPHMLVTKAGILAIFFRKPTNNYVVMRISRNNGYSFESEVAIDNASMFMTYASPWEYDEGIVGLAYGKEGAADDTNADLLYVRLYITIAAGQIDLNVPTGIAPLVVASTTLVTNLNADLLDGLHAADISGAATQYEIAQDSDGSFLLDSNNEAIYVEV